MGIETLIKRLNQYSQSLIAYKLGADFADVCMDAATALSTLQAENEKLRDELERVKADRDAAIEYLREIEWCAGCKHSEMIRQIGATGLDRLRELAQADKMIGKEVWAQAKYLNVFQTKSSFIQRMTIQYVSLLKGKDILCHTKTCAFPLNEIGKTVFLTREEAEEAQRREQDGE